MRNSMKAIKEKNRNPLTPDLFKKRSTYLPHRIFLCGPGLSSEKFNIRSKIKDSLQAYENVTVYYGEEIEEVSDFKRKKTDLQTLEAQFAQSVDFTILILESPGSIAELGTFSMVPNIRSRLFVLVPTRFHRNSSYIARGPLSLISRNHLNNVIYYDEINFEESLKRIKSMLTFYKYIAYIDTYNYYNAVGYKYKPKSYTDESYEKYIGPLRDTYYQALILAHTVILRTPEFSDLVYHSAITPSDTSKALKALFAKGKIEKISGSKYRSKSNYADELLTPFDSSLLSRHAARWFGS
jgi:hypothetical protein